MGLTICTHSSMSSSMTPSDNLFNLKVCGMAANFGNSCLKKSILHLDMCICFIAELDEAKNIASGFGSIMQLFPRLNVVSYDLCYQISIPNKNTLES